MKHKYAPSVLAIYSSARTLIWAVDLLYSWEPTLSSCFMVFWSNCFSAAVGHHFDHSEPLLIHYVQCALCFLVSRAPSLPIVPYALQDLDKVSVLFKRLSEQCPRVSSYVVRISSALRNAFLIPLCSLFWTSLLPEAASATSTGAVASTHHTTR